MPEPSAARGEITLDSVRHLAGLARIELTEAELASLTRDLDSLLHSVAKVSAVATDDIPPTSHPVPIMNVMREDVVAATEPPSVLVAASANTRKTWSVGPPAEKAQ